MEVGEIGNKMEWGYSQCVKCLSYFSLPFVHKGGGPLGPIHFEVLSRRNFDTQLAPYMYTPKTTINKQKGHSKNVVFQNGGQKNKFSFRENSHVTKIWKTTFPMEFFNEIWLKVGKHACLTRLKRRHEKRNNGSKWTPLMHLSVNT